MGHTVLCRQAPWLSPSPPLCSSSAVQVRTSRTSNGRTDSVAELVVRSRIDSFCSLFSHVCICVCIDACMCVLAHACAHVWPQHYRLRCTPFSLTHSIEFSSIERARIAPALKVPRPPHVHPPSVSTPPPQGGNRHLAHERLEINRKSQAPKAPKKIFSWVLLELAGREWCTVPPPQGGNRHLVTVPPGVGGNRVPWGGGAGHGGGG